MKNTLDRLQLVTRQYSHIQQWVGLLPCGLVFTLFGIGSLLGGPAVRQLLLVWHISLLFGGGAIGTMVASVYYRQRFGTVRKSTKYGKVFIILFCFGLLYFPFHVILLISHHKDTAIYCDLVLLLISLAVTIGSYSRRLVSWSCRYLTIANAQDQDQLVEGQKRISVAGLNFVLLAIVALLGTNLGRVESHTNSMVLMAGLFLILAGLVLGLPWRHYTVVGLLLIVVAVLPIFHVVSIEWFWKGWSFMTVGVALFACGLVDYQKLVRNLPCGQAEEGYV